MPDLITPETDLIGKYTGTHQKLAARVHGDPKLLPDVLAVWYVEIGEMFMLRADILWNQMRMETGDLTFPGQVPSKYNNFAGIRKRDGSGFYAFATAKDGVIAHYARMAHHVFENHLPLPYCNGQGWDPKHIGPHAFDVHCVGDLAVWAGGSNTYVPSLIRWCNE